MVIAGNTMTNDHPAKIDTLSKTHTPKGGMGADQVMNTIEAERRQKIADIGHNIRTRVNTTTVHLEVEDDPVLRTASTMRSGRTSRSTGTNTSSRGGRNDMRMNFMTNI